VKHSTATGSAYHHGDLRNALIVAAANLIEESGGTDFAMVDAARKANVSSAAPYRHFKDKGELLQAVNEVAFMALESQMSEEKAKHTNGTQQQIIAMGQHYIRFVTSHPAFFSLMWGEQSRQNLEKRKDEQRHTGFWLLVQAVEDWCAAQQLNNIDSVDLTVKLWSMALGLCSLSINDQLSLFLDNADEYQMLATTTEAFLRGVKEGH
jgi:AcrR family transcriptional regulator